jgi:hypothetical protein
MATQFAQDAAGHWTLMDESGDWIPAEFKSDEGWDNYVKLTHAVSYIRQYRKLGLVRYLPAVMDEIGVQVVTLQGVQVVPD